MKLKLALLFLLVALGVTASADPIRVLFYSKAASWEQPIIHRDGNELSYVEKAAQKLGQENQIDFTFTKDGSMFSPAYLAQFDAFFFFTAGDPVSDDRSGRGDNYPLMTLDGKHAFLDAIDQGKGFIGCNEANYTFPTALSPGEENNATNAWRYVRMIGAGYMGHNEVQKGYFSYMDHKFPGMETVPADYEPVDQWYAFNRLMPDIHVILALDSSKLKGNLYGRPPYPVVWTRMQGKGRVYYTTMGHAPEIWKDPHFLNMLVGAIRWSAGRVDADVTPDIAEITPHATEIPKPASHYIAGDPPVENPHFPNYKVHVPIIDVQPDPAYQTGAPKRVLVYLKSAGYEHPVIYRNGAYPSFLEGELLNFGVKYNIDLEFSKDSTLFTPEKLAQFDAFMFYTSGDPTSGARTGLGDNYPVMSPEGKAAFLQAVRDGKGFIGVNSAIETFVHLPATSATADALPEDPYTQMLGAVPFGSDSPQKGSLVQTDKDFPGMDPVPADFNPVEEWYALKDFQPDMHVLLALDCAKLNGALYHRPDYPVAWARMEGKGRVYYTSMGRSEEVWKDPTFQRMILGAIQWTTGEANANVAPNLDQATPQAGKIPEEALNPVPR